MGVVARHEPAVTIAVVGDDRNTARVHEVSRRLRSRCEAIFGLVFYTPEAAAGTLRLNRVQWYMAGRSAPLGPVTAEVAVAVFGTFNPRLVHAGLNGVWSLVTPDEVIAQRGDSVVAVLSGVVPAGGLELERAIALLSRALDSAEVAGHPLFAALSVLPPPPSPVARLWRLCDMVREHRSDAHVNAWRAFGLDPVEINVLNELWRDVPLGSIACGDMDWDRSDIEAGIDRLVQQGLALDGAITPAGRRRREEVERATSAQQASLVTALGGDADELIGLLDPWARAAANRRRA
jgi:hypothetical protein